MDQPRYRVELDVDPGRERDVPPRPRDPETPFHIAVLGDFSGRGGRQAPSGSPTPLPEQRALTVDRDDMDEVIRRIGPRLELVLDEGASPVPISFHELEDFHPDALHERVELFGELKHRWDELSGLFEAPPATPGESDAAPSGAPAPSDASLLDQIVGGGRAVGEGPPPEGAPSADPLQRFIRRAVASQRVATPTAGEVARRVEHEAARARLMSALLHHPAFRELEAAWRGIDFLVRRIETGPRLKIMLLDVTREELQADAASGGGGLSRLLEANARGPFGEVPWSLLVGLYAFDDTPEDMGLLGRLASAGAESGAPFIAAAAPGLARLDSFADAADVPTAPDERGPWDRFRHSAVAPWVGLAGPRFLLREPYGDDGALCDLEGLEERPGHEEFAWGNPALLVALVLAREFDAHGWAMRPARDPLVGGLPLHVYREEGEARTKPVAETVMTDRLAAHLAAAGLIPVAWLQDTPEVRLVRVGSVADPPAPLRGGWTADD